MTKISIYDIDFKEQGPKIPFEDISFEEVDTYGSEFKEFIYNLTLSDVTSKIDFSKYTDEDNYIKLKEVFGKTFPGPFVDAILEQKRVNDKDRELRDKLYLEKRAIDDQLDGYEEIYRIFRQRDLKQEEINVKVQKATSKSTNRKPTSQRNIKKNSQPKDKRKKFKTSTAIAVITLCGAAIITLTAVTGDISRAGEVKEVNNLAKEYAITMLEETSNGTYNPKTNEFKYDIYNLENIDLGLGVTTPEDYSDLKKIYAFYVADPFGFQKIISTIQYRDPQTGNVCNYTPENFFYLNGFFTIADGQIVGEEYVEGKTKIPSIREFEKYMEENLIKDKNNLIKNGQDEKDLYNIESTTQNDVKGAR